MTSAVSRGSGAASLSENLLAVPVAPAGGATQEDVFRYHLTIELMKLGSQPDTALVDRLVKQHYPDVLKYRREMDQQQAIDTAKPTTDNMEKGGLVPTPPSSESGSISSPMDQVWERLDVDQSVASNLLDLDFDEQAIQEVDPMLYVPPFMDSAKENTTFAQPPTFIQDKVQERETAPGSQSIDPLLVLGAPVLPQDRDLCPPIDTLIAQPTPEVKESYTQLQHPPEHEEDEGDESTFVAFTPMRLRDVKDEFSNRSLSPEPSSLRPSFEEYNKLSSKEKRQLRNKISARNFRNRRKEYITLLEDQVNQRDSLIDKLREKISSLSLENTALREEARQAQTRSSSVDVSKLLDALHSGVDLRSSTPSQLLPNMRKDVSAAPRSSSPAGAFWNAKTKLASSATLVA